jgi:hypothetical protein
MVVLPWEIIVARRCSRAYYEVQDYMENITGKYFETNELE